MWLGPMGAIIVTGIPGVGKTTVMEAAAEKAAAQIVVYGSEMFTVASDKGLVEHRDDMRKLDPAIQKEVQMAAAEKMAAMGDIIVDTHCTIKTPKGYLPGLPAWVLEKLQPTTIVLVEADAAEIKGRRESDATRNRDADSLESIEEHQEQNRRYAASYSVLTGATVHTVYNHDGKVDDAIAQILPVVS